MGREREYRIGLKLQKGLVEAGWWLYKLEFEQDFMVKLQMLRKKTPGISTNDHASRKMPPLALNWLFHQADRWKEAVQLWVRQVLLRGGSAGSSSPHTLRHCRQSGATSKHCKRCRHPEVFVFSNISAREVFALLGFSPVVLCVGVNYYVKCKSWSPPRRVQGPVNNGMHQFVPHMLVTLGRFLKQKELHQL